MSILYYIYIYYIIFHYIYYIILYHSIVYSYNILYYIYIDINGLQDGDTAVLRKFTESVVERHQELT